jgi:hypothetical protein
MEARDIDPINPISSIMPGNQSFLFRESRGKEIIQQVAQLFGFRHDYRKGGTINHSHCHTLGYRASTELFEVIFQKIFGLVM